MNNARRRRIKLNHGVLRISLELKLLVRNVPIPNFVTIRVSRILRRKQVMNFISEFFELSIKFSDHLLVSAFIFDFISVPGIALTVLHQRLTFVHVFNIELKILGTCLTNHDWVDESEVKENNGAAFVAGLKKSVLNVSIQEVDLTKIRRRSFFDGESKAVDVSLKIAFCFFATCLQVGIYSDVLQNGTAIWVQSQRLLRNQLCLGTLVVLALAVMFLHIGNLLVNETKVGEILAPV
mmetsp:Transcript_45308/g.120483  ORF Transcript_45308/g.120483 Transcript_45308/m.120483 type:complete len:237 (-) Transcript_45308:717-1427(-)